MDIRNREGFIPPVEYVEQDLSVEDRPSFQDIQDNAPVGFVKRAITRYLFTKNADRSIKFYSAIGIPYVRKALMGTYGKVFPNYGWSNYRLDAHKNTIEASMNFAVSGSVFNEAIHGGLLVSQSVDTAVNAMDGMTTGEALNDAAVFALNFSLVALQRYNRARLMKRIENELAEGRTFGPEYTNWLGLDADAVENYKDSLLEEIDADTPVAHPEIRPLEA